MEDKLFTWTYGACDSMLEKACKALNYPVYNCHEFRHTFISNLESWKCIKNNWQGIRRRVKNGGNITGSSTESHISHVLSSRLSSRPMGWCREGLDKMAQLRVYWKNGGSMLGLVRYQKEEKFIEETEEERYSSTTEMLTWEKKHRKANGKYIEALWADISSQIYAKIFFNAAIAGL